MDSGMSGSVLEDMSDLRFGEVPWGTVGAGGQVCQYINEDPSPTKGNHRGTPRNMFAVLQWYFLDMFKSITEMVG